MSIIDTDVNNVNYFFLYVRTKGRRKIQTSDLHFIRRSPNQLDSNDGKRGSDASNRGRYYSS
jgi:hypothetical protein